VFVDLLLPLALNNIDKQES